MAELSELIAQVKRLSAKLDKRCSTHERLKPYLEGDCPLPEAVRVARLTKLYTYLMPMSDAPWGSLIVESKLDRLEVAGLRDTDKDAADRVWREVWQANGMDAESKLGHGAALLDGRFYATVWADGDQPTIALDDMTQMVVEFEDGSRRVRKAALRRWREGERLYATLYREDGIYKFRSPQGSNDPKSNEWERRDVPGEDWPLEQPFDRVNVVELRVNGRLKPGAYPHARGEFAHATGLLDRINLLTFIGLVVAVWQGFPLRGVIGEKIRRRLLTDDDGEPLIGPDGKQKTEAVPPFEAKADSVAQFENPDAKVFQLDAADRGNLSIIPELAQLAAITKTPRHYFPIEAMSNISAETVVANEGGLHAAVKGHKAGLGEGWEEVLRLGGSVSGIEISPQAEVMWMDHESRSLGERADAFGKLAANLPWVAAAEIALNVSQEQIARWQGQGAVGELIRAATTPEPPAEAPEEPVAAAG